jgi:hypothetical protein
MAFNDLSQRLYWAVLVALKMAQWLPLQFKQNT